MPSSTPDWESRTAGDSHIFKRLTPARRWGWILHPHTDDVLDCCKTLDFTRLPQIAHTVVRRRYCIVEKNSSIFSTFWGVRVARPQTQEESFDMPMTSKKRKTAKKTTRKAASARGAARKTSGRKAKRKAKRK